MGGVVEKWRLIGVVNLKLEGLVWEKEGYWSGTTIINPVYMERVDGVEGGGGVCMNQWRLIW